MPIEEENQRSDLMILPGILEPGGRKILTYAMTDTGAEGRAFIDEDWARDNGLELTPLKRSFGLQVFDGREAESGRVTHCVWSPLRIHDYVEKRVKLYVTRLAHYPIVLGLPWIKQHNPSINFAANWFVFDSDYYRKFCNMPSRPTKVRALADVPAKARPRYLPARPIGLQERDIAQVSLRAIGAYA